MNHLVFWSPFGHLLVPWLTHSHHPGLSLQGGLPQSKPWRRACLCAQPCPTLCDLMDCSPPGPSAHGVVQARILESVAISPSGAPSRPRAEPACPVSPASAGRFFSLGHPGCPRAPVPPSELRPRWSWLSKHSCFASAGSQCSVWLVDHRVVPQGLLFTTISPGPGMMSNACNTLNVWAKQAFVPVCWGSFSEGLSVGL